MIHERNNSITLDEQIAQIRADIELGKQSFPIDIVDTIGNDSQLYYERADGYQEKYAYDGDGTCIGYWDSTMEVKQVGNLNFIEELKHYFEITPREQVLKDWNESASFDGVGPTVEELIENTPKKLIVEDHTGNSMGDGGLIQKVEKLSERLDKVLEKPYMPEPLVYLVELNEIRNVTDGRTYFLTCTSDKFKEEAISQGYVYSLYQFQENMNSSKINLDTKYMRFI